MKKIIIGLLSLCSLTAMAFPAGFLNLEYGNTGCYNKIEILQDQDGYILSNEYREIVTFTKLNKGRKCYRVEGSGHFFKRTICEKSEYSNKGGLEKLSQGLCSNDLGFRCKPKARIVSLEEKLDGTVSLTQYHRYPTESRTTCVYR